MITVRDQLFDHIRNGYYQYQYKYNYNLDMIYHFDIVQKCNMLIDNILKLVYIFPADNRRYSCQYMSLKYR